MGKKEVLASMTNKHGELYNVMVWVDSRQRLKWWQRKKLMPEPKPYKPRPVSPYVKELYRDMFKNW